jgi:Beta-propeller repeat/CARDB
MNPLYSDFKRGEVSMKQMRKKFSAVIITFGLSLMLASNSHPTILSPDHGGLGKNSGGIEAPVTARLQETYGQLPMSFEANQGQSNSNVKFISRGSGYTLFLTDTEAVLVLKKSNPKTKEGLKAEKYLTHINRPPHPEKVEYTTLRMKLEGAKSDSRVSGLEALPGKANYFIGSDPAKWHTNIPTYTKVQYTGIYPGIDLVYYGHQRQLEYDLVVQPGTDPGRITLAFEGAKGMDLDPSGDLVLQTAGGELHLKKPLVYQEVNGARQPVAAQYVLHKPEKIAGLEVGVKVAAYDSKKPLIIDPVLSYSTYLGSSGDEFGNGIAVDSSGNAYITGGTSSTDFPTVGPLQAVNSGNGDAFVAKLNAAGTALVYSTYLGGSTSNDFGNSIAVDSSGNAYLTGDTASTDFPTVNPIQPTFGGSPYGDAFVAKLNSTGSALAYSSYLGGSDQDEGYGIAVDGSGNAYVAGFTYSTDFPTANPIQAANAGIVDAFVAKLNAAGSALIYSTYLGGSGSDRGQGLAVDGSGNAYVTGWTNSLDFPVASPLQATNGGSDAFVSKLNAAGSALVYSTYLGGNFSGEFGYGIAVDGSGNAYVTGQTESNDFPTCPSSLSVCASTGTPLQSANAGGYNFRYNDAFIAKVNSAGSALIYSTYLGGSGDDLGYGIAVDGSGNAYVTGWTNSSDFPIASPLQTTFGGPDAFVAKLNAGGSTLSFSTYLGGSFNDSGQGIAVDGSGNAYVTGYANSPDFPTVNPLQPIYGGESIDNHVGDAIVAKIGSPVGNLPDLIMTNVTPNASMVSAGGTLPVTDTVANQGGADSGSFRIGYHLSTDSIYGNSDDVLISTTRVVPGPFAAGASSPATTSLAIPSTAPGGTYYLCAMADSLISANTPLGQVIETIETNNTNCAGPITVTTSSPPPGSLPDLIMTNVTPNATTAKKGGTLSVTTTVANLGGATGTTFRIGFHLSGDATYGGPDDVAITVTRLVKYGIGAGVSSPGTTSLTLPGATPSGLYYVCALADSLITSSTPQGQVVETIETNNTWCSTPIQVTVP